MGRAQKIRARPKGLVVAIALEEMAAAFVSAGADGGEWGAPLGLVEHGFGARGVILMSYNAQSGALPSVELCASAGMPAQEENYKADFAAIDHRAAFCFAAEPGRLLHDDMIADARVRARMPIYADFLNRFDIGRFAAVNLGSVGAVVGASTFFSASFANDAGQLSAARARALTSLAQYVRAAVRTASVIQAFAPQETGLREALERRDVAAFMVDRDGTLLDFNAAGRRLAGKGDLIALRCGALCFLDPQAQHQFELQRRADWRLEASSAWSAQGRGQESAKIIALNGLGRELGLRADALLLLVLRARAPVRFDLAALARLGLSASDRALAEALVAGFDPIELALAHGAAFEVLDRRMQALCAMLGVSGFEPLRAVLASVARPH
jgi:PAS domain-containing protein